MEGFRERRAYVQYLEPLQLHGHIHRPVGLQRIQCEALGHRQPRARVQHRRVTPVHAPQGVCEQGLVPVRLAARRPAYAEPVVVGVVRQLGVEGFARAHESVQFGEAGEVRAHVLHDIGREDGHSFGFVFFNWKSHFF